MTAGHPFHPPARRRELRRAGALRRRRLHRRHLTGGLVLAGGLVFGAGAALAAFTTTGSGTASVSVPDPSLGVTAGMITATGLYPGATVPAEVVVVNDGPAPILLTDVVGSGSATATNCPGDAVGVVPPSSLPTMTPTATTTLTVGVTMAADAPPACQDVAFQVAVTVDGRIG